MDPKTHRTRVMHWLALVAILASTLLGAIPSASPVFAAPAARPVADHTANPTSVTIVGSLQSELGCAGDWDPSCASTFMDFDAEDDVWQKTFSVPMGDWLYKAALNGSWAENYGANAVFDGPNIPLNLGAGRDVKFYYDHKSHWVADNANNVIATAAGDFQSEVGCTAGPNGGDWEPSCLRSWLQDVDGDGIYTFETTAIPPGSYQAKVALNESWDVSYGQGGGGDNIPFTVGMAGDKVTISFDSTTNIPTISVATTLPVDPATLVRDPIRHPIQNDVFYFVMPDRFENGDPTNDEGGLVGDRLVTGFDPTDKGFFHGGDLAGMIDRLGYLDNMGVTAIWMTPVFKNRPVQGSGVDISAGYHGYWITDFTQFDPHFGTNAELEQLITEAHARGIKVFFDIITNHTADIIQYEEGVYDYRSKADFPFRDSAGLPFDDRDFINSPAFPPLDPAVSFAYTPVITPTDATVKVPAWLNNPIYYHNRGNSQFSGENSLYGDFFGLDDLFTTHPQVVSGLTDIYETWVKDYGIDGFRIDTMKHVNAEFWDVFAPAIQAAAQSVGKPNFFAFGEVFSGNEQLLSFYTTSGEVQAVLDFKFQEQVGSFVASGGSAKGLQEMFQKDDYFTDDDSNVYALPTFLGNHDRGRFAWFVQNGRAGASDDEKVQLVELGHALMYFARGVPVVYYGDEQGFVGAGGDKDARQDMMPSQVAEYNAQNLIGTDATTADSNFDLSHPLYQSFTDLAAVRAAHKALRDGAQIDRFATDGPGVYAFSRIDRTEKVEYVLAFNNTITPTNAAIQTFYGAGERFDLLASSSTPDPTIFTDGDGKLAVDVPAYGYAVYQAAAAVPASGAAPAIAFSTLANDQEVQLGYQNLDGNQVPLRMEVGVNVGGSGYNEVTFAVREVPTVGRAAGDFMPIGTDDSAPYRVFYDASDWPAGTKLEFMAVVNDLNGHVNGAFVTGIAPSYEEQGGGTVNYDHVVVHYQRPGNDYGDHTTGDYNDYWGLHLWGDGLADGAGSASWQDAKPFLGEDSWGRFAWIELKDAKSDVNFIVHKGDSKDPGEGDRKFNPATDGPEVWLKQGDWTVYKSQAAAQGYVTIHYNRPDGVYDGWGLHLWGDAIDDSVSTSWDTPRPYDNIDAFGAYWNVPIVDATQQLNYILHKGGDKDPNGDDQSLIPSQTPAVWIKSMTGIFTQACAADGAFGSAILHYHRPAGDYGDYNSSNFEDFWGLHTWGAAEDPGWITPRKPAEVGVFGPRFEVPRINGNALGYILHRGGTKDQPADQSLDFAKWGCEVWQAQGADPENPYILPILRGTVAAGDLNKARAHWIDRNTIAWDVEPAGDTTGLYYSLGGAIVLNGDLIQGYDNVIPLIYDPQGLSAAQKAKWPHLADYKAYRIGNQFMPILKNVLKMQLAVATGTTQFTANATSVQIPGVLDDLYPYDGALGATYTGENVTVAVWAPTARNVSLQLITPGDNGPARSGADTIQTITMTENISTGVWSATGARADWYGKGYRFDVNVYAPAASAPGGRGAVVNNIVTDPYAVALNMNSEYGWLVDLDDATLKPAGWNPMAKPPLAAPEDIVLYELHMRDFSVNDPTVPAADRGKYTAFTHLTSNGMRHLIGAAQAGLTHVHLLPVFDIATINEDPAQRVEPNIPLTATADSPEQQAAVVAVADQDAFNWGYDPYHYTVPEGSYSTNPNDTTRIVEFRKMVQALHAAGLRVVMDVVYNHTNASGQAQRSVLDKIVPGYYHRLNLDGVVETSTCCANTASEHAMMEKLMVDSLKVWATQYGVDAFRFDLMGHHMKSNMLKVQQELAAIDPTIYIYGEGWNFGEVANDARGVNATQLNMAGTGIGTFNDRLRDAVRGGGPFDGGDDLVRNQGFASGLWTKPNALNTGSDAEKNRLLLYADQIRVGLAGNLADYEFVDRTGALVKGSQVDYNGSPAGYTQDPQEHIVYSEAHDNQTLYDIIAYKLPLTTTMANRVRYQMLGLDVVLLSQGVPFIHAGSEMLRSKSFDRDSYNSGDWFNKLDFTYQSNNYGVGLPVQGVNGANWNLIQPRLADASLKPASTDIQASVAHIANTLQMRKSSPLFRLQTEADIMARLKFYNTGAQQIPGLIVMSLSDKVNGLPDIDPVYEEILVFFNASDEQVIFTDPTFINQQFGLHPLEAAANPVARAAGFDPATGRFTIPALGRVAFVQNTPTALDEVDEPQSEKLFLPMIDR
jgi:pullulanase-type alpha-1,6-glucosidase